MPDNDNHYDEKAKWGWMRSAWVDLYFAIAFSPFQATQKFAEFTQSIFEDYIRQLQDPTAFWQEAEDKVLRPSLQLTSEVADFWSEMAGKPPDMGAGFGMAAQKYVAILMALATKLSTTPELLIREFLMREFTPAAYFHRVQDLAQIMSRRAGQQATTGPLEFWISAENHILTMLAGVAAAVQTEQDAKHYFTRISDLSSEEYLGHIEQGAYHIWERAGKFVGAALDHWLESEKLMLKGIREQIASSPLGSSSIALLSP